MLFIGIGMASAAQQTINHEGAFDYTIRTQVNSNFTELYNAVYNSAAVASSTSLTSNPLEHLSAGGVTTAQANSAVTILAGNSNYKIYPSGGFTLMASGTASGATSVSVKCSSGNIIATFPIAMLVTGIPVNAFVSAGSTHATLASALTEGCPKGDGIMISSAGTLATTTNLYYTLPFIVQ